MKPVRERSDTNSEVVRNVIEKMSERKHELGELVYEIQI